MVSIYHKLRDKETKWHLSKYSLISHSAEIALPPVSIRNSHKQARDKISFGDSVKKIIFSYICSRALARRLGKHIKR